MESVVVNEGSQGHAVNGSWWLTKSDIIGCKHANSNHVVNRTTSSRTRDEDLAVPDQRSLIATRLVEPDDISRAPVFDRDDAT